MEQTRVALAGGSLLLHDGMVASLRRDRRLKVVIQEQDVHKAVALATERGCDVFILNTETLAEDIAGVAERLGREPGSPKVLVLTSSEQVNSMTTALRAGARGYGVRQILTAQDLRAAVFALVKWGVWLCPLTTQKLVHLIASGASLWMADRIGKGVLSAREQEVLRLFADGAGEEVIAAELYLSRNSVKTYLRRICQKLDVSTRAEALTVAIRQGFLPDRRAP